MISKVHAKWVKWCAPVIPAFREGDRGMWSSRSPLTHRELKVILG